MKKVLASIRKAALALPNVDEGIACAGTPLEKSTYRVKKKAFLFVGNKGDSFDAMLKLDASLGEATKLATKSPATYKVGKGGWVSAKFTAGEPPPAGLLERWLRESHSLIGGAPAPAPARAPAKKPASKTTAATKTAAKNTTAKNTTAKGKTKKSSNAR